MASTTSNKKAIVDFLWEWAESQGDWSKLLLSKIVTTESPLIPAVREEVFKYFLRDIGLNAELPELKTAKPSYIPTTRQIELETLSDIRGVNRLATDQVVSFAKNITVIYGENGTGKTGYSRILKILGFSYDTNNNVLPNIYKASEPQSATINFKSDGSSKTFTWNGANTDSELANISVFNSSCVQFSINDRGLIVSPSGFHLFQLVSDELKELTQLLQKKISVHPTTIIWFENLTAGTAQYKFIESLSATSTEEKLTELSDFTAAHQTILTEKESELANLNQNLIEIEIQAKRSQIQEIDSFIRKIQNAQRLLTADNWQALISFNKEVSELESKTQTGIKEIAEQRGIEFYQTKEFNSFIQAAENYIKIIDNSEYPTDGDTCVYCFQPLDISAKELLRQYRNLLNDKTQENLKALRIRKAALIETVKPVDTNLIFHQATFGTDANQAIVQPKEITDYNQDLGILKNSFVTDDLAEDSIFTFDYQAVINFLNEKRTIVNTDLTQKSEALGNLAAQEKTLRDAIAELKDRKLLSGKVAEVRKIISNHKIVNTLYKNGSSFNTTAISRKTTSAREELVRQDFEELFKNELKALRKASLKIDLSFGTERGNSKVSQSISGHALGNILSEGEQKAIALAEFLTELQLDNTKAPIVFDDPVNSLDHRIIDEVVKRLVRLSEDRQVIVFTHSILLLHSFIQQHELDHNKQAGVQFMFHRVKQNFETTGILDEVEDINSYSYYKKKLQLVLQTQPSGEDEAVLAARGYGHLRSAIEITVEDDLFKKTVKRYKKGVAFPSLLRVNGGKIDEYKSKLNDIYEKCCISIDGHSSPEEIQTTPTMAELRSDFESFEEIRKAFTK
jgi:wobble nucleotide-excising tRNase